MLITDLAVLDHTDATVLLIANAVGGTADSYDDAVTRLDAMAADLTKAVPPGVATLTTADAPPVTSNMAPGVYEAGVERVREHVRAGDVFQTVLSQRFELETDVDALDLYRVLRATNPSPYMYLLRFAGRESPFDVVGSSPEALVTVTGASAVVPPPAGPRPRGATPRGGWWRGPGRRPASPRRPAPAPAVPRRRRTCAWPSRCWPTPRSGP